MHKPEILPSAPSPSPQHGAWMLDACQLGVVLRTVLAVQLLLAVAALYSGAWGLNLLWHWAWLTSGGLLGSLGWLLLTCASKRWLQQRPAWLQYGWGVVLGMGCGALASAVLAFTDPSSPLPAQHWGANMLTAGLLAALLMGWLALRNQGRTPAATTAQLALLQARIRPHFLFNALNSAIALVREQPAQAEALLEDLSDLFRAALQEQRSTIPLAEEVELAQRYLAIEQLRFGPRMRVQWQVQPQALDCQVPPLLLQPLVENAVKHGVEGLEEGAQIRIGVYAHSAAYIGITVTNTTGESVHANRKGLGMALANVRHRLQLMYDVDCGFAYKHRHGVFQVRLRLPRQRLHQAALPASGRK